METVDLVPQSGVRLELAGTHDPVHTYKPGDVGVVLNHKEPLTGFSGGELETSTLGVNPSVPPT